MLLSASTQMRSFYIASILAAFQLYSMIAAVTADDEKSYIINPGDQLLITVVGHEKELTALVVVRPDGMVTYDVVGDVKAAGLTIAQLSAEISRLLSEIGYYEKPQVTVQLRELSREDIYVFGDVVDPGQKRFLKSITIIEALAAAGGYRETADLTSARIIKTRKKAIIPVDLGSLKKNITDQNPVSNELLDDRFMLEGGDVLIIPSAMKEEQIGVIGHVHKPGLFTVRSSASPVEALALAGGALETADLKHISIITNGGTVVIDATRAWTKINSQQPLDQGVVQPGDVVFVPEKGRLNILGNVKNQGRFPVDTEISVIEALALAGIGEDADLKKLKIVKSTGEQIIVDASKLWKHPERYAKDKLSPGDTLVVPPKHFKINWNAIYALVMVFSTLYAVFK